jgi:SAM-dependent methyltransferase
MDPLAESPWSNPETVAGFTTSQPNPELIRFAQREFHASANRCLDIGCGAGRNAIMLAGEGWRVVGIDLSLAMLRAAVLRARNQELSRFQVALAPMDRLPARSRSFDLIVAHGIWNLARSADEFRRGIAEAARVAAVDAALFVFTFSRSTLPAAAAPVVGEPFVFTQFSGEPQCFLTEDQLVSELREVGFVPDADVPLRELNLPRPGTLCRGEMPVIYEGVFRFSS